MAAGWQRNEPTPISRRCDLIVNMSDGVTPADRSLNLVALGLVYFCGANSPHYDVALGTMTNKRRPLVAPDDVVEAVVGNTMTLTGHAYETGDGPFVSDETMGPLAVGAEFYVIVDDANTIAIASSLANAYSDTRVVLTGTETGATISDKATTERGIDGLFTYEATQAETDHAARESTVLVIGTLPGDSAPTRAFTTVSMAADADAWGSELENGYTRDDALRVCFRTLAAAFTVIGTLIQFRNIANTKDSHKGTVTGSGRSDTVIQDPT